MTPKFKGIREIQSDVNKLKCTPRNTKKDDRSFVATRD